MRIAMINKCFALLVVSSLVCLAYGVPSKTQSSAKSVAQAGQPIRPKRQVLFPQQEIIEIIEMPNPYLSPFALGRKKRDVSEDIEINETVSKTNLSEKISREKRQVLLPQPKIIEIIEMPNPYLSPFALGRKKRDVAGQEVSREKRQVLFPQPKIIEIIEMPNPYLSPFALGRKKRDVTGQEVSREKRQVLLPQPKIIEIIEMPNPYLSPFALGRKKRDVSEDIEINETVSKTNLSEKISREKRQVLLSQPKIIEIIEMPNPYLSPFALGRKKRDVAGQEVSREKRQVLFPQPKIIEIIEMPNPYLSPFALGRK